MGILTWRPKCGVRGYTSSFGARLAPCMYVCTPAFVYPIPPLSLHFVLQESTYRAWTRLIRSWGVHLKRASDTGPNESRLSLLVAPLRFAWQAPAMTYCTYYGTTHELYLLWHYSRTVLTMALLTNCTYYGTTHAGTTHDATAHDGTTYAATTHDATAHGATTHDATTHGATTHGATAHGATTHAGTTHDATTHGATTHDATAHGATTHAATTHDATAHDATTHAGTTHDATAHGATTHGATGHCGRASPKLHRRSRASSQRATKCI